MCTLMFNIVLLLFCNANCLKGTIGIKSIFVLVIIICYDFTVIHVNINSIVKAGSMNHFFHLYHSSSEERNKVDSWPLVFFFFWS